MMSVFKNQLTKLLKLQQPALRARADTPAPLCDTLGGGGARCSPSPASLAPHGHSAFRTGQQAWDSGPASHGPTVTNAEPSATSETTNLEVVVEHGGRVQGAQDARPQPTSRAAPGGTDDVLGQGRVFCRRKHRGVTSRPRRLPPRFSKIPDERGARRVLGSPRWRLRAEGKLALPVPT